MFVLTPAFFIGAGIYFAVFEIYIHAAPATACSAVCTMNCPLVQCFKGMRQSRSDESSESFCRDPFMASGFILR